MRKDSTSRAAPVGEKARHCTIAVALATGLLASSPTYAYIDPGTGSILLQGLLASLAVGLGVARTYWHRIKAFFNASKPAPPVDSRNADGEETEAQSKT